MTVSGPLVGVHGHTVLLIQCSVGLDVVHDVLGHKGDVLGLDHEEGQILGGSREIPVLHYIVGEMGFDGLGQGGHGIAPLFVILL